MENHSKELIIIIPNLPPIVCGIGNYAIKLSHKLLDLGKYEKIYVGGNTITELDNQQDKIEFGLWSNFLKFRNRNIDVFINYSPSAYSRFGFPIQLLNELNIYKSKNPLSKIITLFHETWLDGTNMRIHHKIRNKLSKITGKKLLDLSNNSSVLTKEQFIRLETIAKEKEILIQKIAPNIEPPKGFDVLNSSRNNGEFVIFGLAHTRLWTLEKNAEVIKTLFRNGIVKKIYSIGPIGNDYANRELELSKTIGDGFEYEQLGICPSEKISERLLQSIGGFIGQTIDSIPKSSSFWAFASHGLAVICPERIENLGSLKQLIFSANALIEDPENFESEQKQKANDLYHWYLQTHSWNIIAQDFYDWLNK